MNIKIEWDDMKEMFLLYSNPSSSNSNRSAFIKKATSLFDVTEREACLIWQAFDMFCEQINWDGVLK